MTSNMGRRGDGAKEARDDSFQMSFCAYHPNAAAMLIVIVSFQFYQMSQMSEP